MKEEERLTAALLAETETQPEAQETSKPSETQEVSMPSEALDDSPSLQESKRRNGVASKRAKRVTTKKAASITTEQETPEEAQALWERVPRHVQALIRTQSDEVAQNSYKDFRETRSDLIRRLLDPELSLEEAARVLGVCPTTVRRYTNRGLLPHHRTPGNQRRFRLSHVLEFMERFGVTLNEAEKRASGKPEGAWEVASDQMGRELVSVSGGSLS
jgi:excisionase family DNA binding protein